MDVVGHVLVVQLALVGAAAGLCWRDSLTPGFDLALSSAGFGGVLVAPTAWRFKILVLVVTVVALAVVRAGLRARDRAHHQRAAGAGGGG